jgi:hypothetical protein
LSVKIDHQIGEEMILRDEVSDEALEAAAPSAAMPMSALPPKADMRCSQRLRQFTFIG